MERAEFYFAAVQRFRQQAQAAHEAGNNSLAASNLLEASRNLLQLAQSSTGAIREAQMEKARLLRDLAVKVSKEPVRASRKNAGKAVESGSADEEASGPDTWLLRERPDVRLADVAGLEEVKTVLREKVLEPFRRPEVYRRYRADHGAGVLLYGPPGNGKTFIARAIAGELDAPFFSADPSQIKDKYVGETAKNLRRLFEEAMACERAVLFLDEVEAILGKRGNRKVDSVTQFLALTDGLTKVQNCLLLLCATNKPWALDEAVMRRGRVGTHVYVGLPDAAAREAILGINMKGVPLAEGVAFRAIAERTGQYSGADMRALCDVAKQQAVNRELASNREDRVIAADFELALQKVRPGTTQKQIHEFTRWRDGKDGPVEGDDDD